MIVNAEIRDKEKLKKENIQIILIYTVCAVVFLILVAAFVNQKEDTVAEYVLLLLLFVWVIYFIVQTVVVFIKANKCYKVSWLTTGIDFEAANRHIYVNNKKMHVNYEAELNHIYVHDIDDFGKTYKCTILCDD